MSQPILRHLLCGTTALAILSPAAAFAADAPPQSLGFEQIIVTAQKRAENLQEVPIQVTAFTEQKIADAGIKNTSDFVAMVPNMQFDTSFSYLNSFVTIRGISQLNNGDSPVAIVIDGVPQNNQKQFKMNLVDIERIEVLKGPQGALYGRNASGGAVNIVTRQPTNDFEGFVNGTYGNGDAWELSGGVSGPIVQDKLLFRVSGYYKQDDGRIENTYLKTNADYIDHDYSVRGKLKFLANDDLTLDLRGSYTNFKAGGLYDSALIGTGTFDTVNHSNDYAQPSEDFLGTTFGNIKDLTFKFDWNLDFATMIGISSYTDLKEYNRGDLDFTNTVNNPGGFLGALGPVGQGQNLDTQMYSQELRFVSPDDQRLRWIAGAYYLHTDRKLLTRGYFDIDHSYDQFYTGTLVANNAEDNSNDAYAFFGQLDFDITDGLTLQGALRYDHDKRNQTDLNTSLKRKKAFDAIQPKVTLTYKFDDDRLVYATYSTGFRSGGFNAPNVPLQVFNDETLQNFEGGFKTSWLDNRLILNGAVYFQKVDDFQIFFVEALNAAQYLANIDKVDIFGVELEFQAMPVEGLEIYGSLGTTDSEIKRNSLDPSIVGNQTPKNMRWKMNLGFQYRASLSDSLSGVMRVDYEHRGKKIWQLNNVDFQRPLDIFNARVGIEGEKWGLYAWGKNLTNEHYYGDYNPIEYSGLGLYDIGFLAQPRTYGIEGRYKF